MHAGSLFSWYVVDISFSTSGFPTTGEIYTLECSVSGTSDPAMNFQWFLVSADNETELISDDSITINSNSSISQLQFSPLRTSHGGLYTCQVRVGDEVVEGTTTVEINRKFCIGYWDMQHTVPALLEAVEATYTCVHT